MSLGCNYERFSPPSNSNWPELSKWTSEGWMSAYQIFSNTAGNCLVKDSMCTGTAGVLVQVQTTHSFWTRPVTLQVS
ncbi:MAG: hypothetical protein ACXABY_22350, partial [Candidatus Thorarchaeota archaeon]